MDSLDQHLKPELGINRARLTPSKPVLPGTWSRQPMPAQACGPRREKPKSARLADSRASGSCLEDRKPFRLTATCPNNR